MDGIDEKGVVFLRDIKHSEKRGGFLHDIVDFVRFPDGVGVMQIVTSAHLFDLCRKKTSQTKGVYVRVLINCVLLLTTFSNFCSRGDLLGGLAATFGSWRISWRREGSLSAMNSSNDM